MEAWPAHWGLASEAPPSEWGSPVPPAVCVCVCVCAHEFNTAASERDRETEENREGHKAV